MIREGSHKCLKLSQNRQSKQYMNHLLIYSKNLNIVFINYTQLDVSIICHLCPPSQIQYLNHLKRVGNRDTTIPIVSFRYLTRCFNGWEVQGIQVSKCVAMPCSGQSAATTQSGCRWGGWELGSGREALPQELYGEDLVTAMTDRVNFTVNHYHQVKNS